MGQPHVHGWSDDEEEQVGFCPYFSGYFDPVDGAMCYGCAEAGKVEFELEEREVEDASRPDEVAPKMEHMLGCKREYGVRIMWIYEGHKWP